MYLSAASNGTSGRQLRTYILLEFSKILKNFLFHALRDLLFGHLLVAMAKLAVTRVVDASATYSVFSFAMLARSSVKLSLRRSVTTFIVSS